MYLTQTIIKEKRNTNSLSAYLLNMAIRLLPMKRVLKNGGNIFLHCDPTASHYLKLVMDAIFGYQNFQNEIIWSYKRWPAKQDRFQRMHDVIFWYTNGHDKPETWNQLYGELAESTKKTWGTKQQVADFSEGYRKPSQTEKESPGAPMRDVWEFDELCVSCYEENTEAPTTDVWPIGIIAPIGKERLGYPTQKPLKLIKRIVEACSKEGDVVLDPFCGCGTTVHAAEELKRRWIGIDVSKFSTGLIRERLVKNFQDKISIADIEIIGTPSDLVEAQALADKDKFEFEKWVCGEIGAHGMFHDPGEKGADGGVDGVIEFGLFEGWERGVEKSYAIVQVKGGHVTADSVRALYATVKRFNAKAGIFVCFDRYMQTVENSRIKCTYKDMSGTYPVIQGFSVEDLLNNEKPKLPPLVTREGGKMKNTPDLFANH